MLNNLTSFIGAQSPLVGPAYEGWQLYKECENLHSEWQSEDECEQGIRSDRVHLALQLSLVVLRCLKIYVYVVNYYDTKQLDQKGLTPEQQAAIRGKIKEQTQRIYSLKCVQLFFESLKDFNQRRDLFTANRLFSAASLVCHYIGREKLGSLISGFGFTLKGVLNLPWACNQLSNFTQFQSDWYSGRFAHSQKVIGTYQFKEVSLNTDYESIPTIYKDNQVFRLYRCYLTGETIRFPVIVVQEHDDASPLLPVRLFERKTLLEYLSHNDTYPGTRIQIDLCQVREHLAVKKEIANELIQMRLDYLWGLEGESTEELSDSDGEIKDEEKSAEDYLYD